MSAVDIVFYYTEDVPPPQDICAFLFWFHEAQCRNGMHLALALGRELVIIAEFEREIAVVIRDPRKRPAFEDDGSTVLVPGTQIALVLRRRRKRKDAHPTRGMTSPLPNERRVLLEDCFARHLTHQAEQPSPPRAAVCDFPDLAPEKFPDKIAAQAVQLALYR